MKSIVRLFHISEVPGISLFEPRPSPHRSAGVDGLIVWAIDGEHIQNYFLPRGCPGVTFFASPNSTAEDIATLLGPSGAAHVIAVESCWISRIRSQSIGRYEFDPTPFEPEDETAGYWICR